MSSTYVLAPVLNEAENMPNLVQGWRDLAGAFPQRKFQFVLIDDGSTDDTTEVARREANALGLTLEVHRHTKNQGPGAAFGTGFAALTSRLTKDDLVVTMEGDNTSRVETLKIMFGRIEREGVSVVLASPYAYGGGITNTSFHRVFLSHIANGLVKAFVDIHGIHTMSSFFRIYRGEVILALQQRWGAKILERRGFECMIELLRKIVILHVSISEVPMKLDTSLRKGKSKMKVLRTIRGYFAVMMRARSW